MGRPRLSPLFDPQSLVVYGASEAPHCAGRLLLEGLTQGGFRGRYRVVHPTRDSVLGMACVRSAAALDFVPDVALLASGELDPMRVMEDCAARGTRFLVMFDHGLNTTLDEHPRLRAELISQARRLGVRLIGPHCTALMRPSSGLQAGYAPQGIKPGRMALLSQSGAVCAGMLDWAASAGLGFSSVLAQGASIDLDFGEMLDWFQFDAQTDSVLLYLERIEDARSFMSTVRALARVKPVIIMKAARGGLHEGSQDGGLIPADRVVDAAISRAGAVRVDTTQQLLATARLLALRKRPGGSRLAILANGDGLGVIAADAAVRRQLELAVLSDASIATLDALIPGGSPPINPVNLHADADAARIEAAVRAVLADDGVDAVLISIAPQSSTPSEAAADAIHAASSSQAKPVTVAMVGGASVAAGKKRLDALGVAHFLSAENAIDALSLLRQFARNQRTLRQVPDASDPNAIAQIDTARAIRDAALSAGRVELSETEARALLAAFGIGLRQESRAGALPSGATVIAAMDQAPSRTACLGLHTDPVFGAVIAFGAGGPAFRQIDDIALELPPLNATLVRGLIARTQLSRRLGAFGEVPAVDAIELQRLLLRLSTLVCACPWIDCLRINALNLDDLDVGMAQITVSLRAEAQADTLPWRGEYGHLAIHPYPRELEESLALRDGRSVRLRPIRPEDADAERAFIAALSPETLYRRFMMPVKALPDALIERFTQIDYDRELALVAIETVESAGDASGAAPTQRIAAVGRILPTWDDGVAEFAIVVGDWMQHSGVGRELMLRLIAAARSRGYRMLEGIVLAQNQSMLKFCAKLGFKVSVNPEDSAERLARMDLNPGS